MAYHSASPIKSSQPAKARFDSSSSYTPGFSSDSSTNDDDTQEKELKRERRRSERRSNFQMPTSPTATTHEKSIVSCSRSKWGDEMHPREQEGKREKVQSENSFGIKTLTSTSSTALSPTPKALTAKKERGNTFTSETNSIDHSNHSYTGLSGQPSVMKPEKQNDGNKCCLGSDNPSSSVAEQDEESHWRYHDYHGMPRNRSSPLVYPSQDSLEYDTLSDNLANNEQPKKLNLFQLANLEITFDEIRTALVERQIVEAEILFAKLAQEFHRLIDGTEDQ